MILEAGREGCVREVLVIAAALSIQDPRERPLEHATAADASHRRFDVVGQRPALDRPLWDHLREQQRQMSTQPVPQAVPRRVPQLSPRAGVAGPRTASCARSPASSGSAPAATRPAPPDAVHRAVLSGLLSHIGMRDRRRPRVPRRPRRVVRDRPGIGALQAPPRWVMAAELVETDRLRARRVATISPSGPNASVPTSSSAATASRGGTPVAGGRRDRDGDAVRAADRDRPHRRPTTGSTRCRPARMFIRHALVDGDWTAHHAFLGAMPRSSSGCGRWRRGSVARAPRRRPHRAVLRRTGRRRRDLRPPLRSMVA